MTRRGLIGRRVAMVALCAASALVGIGCTQSTAATSTSGPAVRPATAARLEITVPAPNEVTGRNVSLVVRLDGARLVPPTQVGGRIRADRGHIHVSVDGQLVAMPNGLTDPLPPLTPGAHTVQAEFVASDHLPFSNRVVAAVTFRVR